MDRFLRRFPLVVQRLASAPPAPGRRPASISGTARDQSGAVLPGVTITATQTETGLVRTTVTNETGSYMLRICRSGHTASRRPSRGVPHVRANWCRPASQQQPRD